MLHVVSRVVRNKKLLRFHGDVSKIPKVKHEPQLSSRSVALSTHDPREANIFTPYPVLVQLYTKVGNAPGVQQLSNVPYCVVYLDFAVCTWSKVIRLSGPFSIIALKSLRRPDDMLTSWGNSRGSF